ncbi:MAG: hypothetical protein ACI3Z9_09150 [Candidatus Onthomorpha sp.]
MKLKKILPKQQSENQPLETTKIKRRFAKIKRRFILPKRRFSRAKRRFDLWNLSGYQLFFLILLFAVLNFCHNFAGAFPKFVLLRAGNADAIFLFGETKRLIQKQY